MTAPGELAVAHDRGRADVPVLSAPEQIGWFAITLLSKKWALPPAVTLLGALFAILGLAYLIHRLVERPLGPRIKRAFLPRSTPVGVTPDVRRLRSACNPDCSAGTDAEVVALKETERSVVV